MDCCCERYKSKERSTEEKKNLEIRINKIIGQLNGIKGMIDDNRYCADILTQVSAVQSALKELSYIILDDHLHTCVSNDIKNENYESLDEAIKLMKKLR